MNYTDEKMFGDFVQCPFCKTLWSFKHLMDGDITECPNCGEPFNPDPKPASAAEKNHESLDETGA